AASRYRRASPRSWPPPRTPPAPQVRAEASSARATRMFSRVRSRDQIPRATPVFDEAGAARVRELAAHAEHDHLDAAIRCLAFAAGDPLQDRRAVEYSSPMPQQQFQQRELAWRELQRG